MNYVYIESETAKETGTYPLYTVGFYAPDGTWHSESDHGGMNGKRDAARRVNYLNGGNYSYPDATASFI